MLKGTELATNKKINQEFTCHHRAKYLKKEGVDIEADLCEM